MTDREMIELAAKAAGVEGKWGREGYFEQYEGFIPTGWISSWNPLTDDGNAFRLMVKLKLTPHFYQEHNTTYVATDAVPNPEGFDCLEHWDTNPEAATRRAIARAAAEIGRGMP